MDDLQIDRIFNAIADMDRRFSTKLDAIQDAQGNLKADVTGLTTWRDTKDNSDRLFWTQTWPSEQTRHVAVENRLRSMETLVVGLNKLDVVEKRLEHISDKLEEVPTKSITADLEKRVTALEKVVVRANVIWASVSIVGGIGFQIFLHYFFGK